MVFPLLGTFGPLWEKGAVLSEGLHLIRLMGVKKILSIENPKFINLRLQSLPMMFR